MRSRSFLRKSHLLIKRAATLQSFPLTQPSHSYSSALHSKRPQLVVNTLPGIRSISSNYPPPPVDPGEDATELALQALESTSADLKSVPEPLATINETDKLNLSKQRRTRITSSSSNGKDAEPLHLPPGLDILWLPNECTLDSAPANDALPPPEILEEALDNLLITLHPQSQHRAVHGTEALGRPVEPTLGLYCPIEGGHYVVDATVRELARRTGSEVLVLDAVQLAAGQWGEFGKAASSLVLPRNPLHFSAPSPPPTEFSRQLGAVEQEEEESPFILSTPSRISIPGLKGAPSMPSRPLMASSSRRPTTPSKLEIFFDTLVNLPSTSPVLNSVDSLASSGSRNPPRLIYIRDFPTLASSSSHWYPALLAAVKQRRRGPLSRTSNIISSPVTIIFGMTPPITPPFNEGPSGATSSLMSLLMSRNSSSSQVAFGGTTEVSQDWSESEAGEIAREKRLRSRLKRWEKNATALHDEFPRLSTKQDSGDNPFKSDIIVIGGPPGSSAMPPMLGMPIGLAIADSDADSNSQFFRSSVVVPTSRSLTRERDDRIARRREINELTIRMGVGAVGGAIESTSANEAFIDVIKSQNAVDIPPSPESLMWENWGDKVEVWSNVRKVADRAMGSVMAAQQASDKQEKLTLDPTMVPWTAVQSAWAGYHSLADSRKNWLKEASSHKPNSDLPDSDGTVSSTESAVDKVVESVKNDPDLEQHEQRLLPCIIDPSAMTTTFNQVHLPTHTIDSVRTIVSLPLLHPHAFKQGILKDHSMTGCLLFGPPGTGKTLVVRALAKEAGCRMLAISPSDVMDMYVGEGEKLVRAVFSLARRLSPCVIFLDEIDALFGARMSARESGSAFAHRGVITEFMQEMDGLKSSKEDNVIVIGATNRPFDLDDAVLRRLPRRLLVDLPGEKERQEILKILLHDEVLSSDVTVDVLAKRTESFSGSDLKHLCVSAALDSVKEHVELPWVSSRNSKGSTVTTSSLAQESPISPTLAIDPASSTSGLPPSNVSVDAISRDPSHHTSLTDESPQSVIEKPASTEHPVRVLYLRNFIQALKEITPSSSESLGSLSDLRKWNEEFGEGRRDRKKRQVWGKGRFGFVDHANEILEEGRVAKTNP